MDKSKLRFPAALCFLGYVALQRDMAVRLLNFVADGYFSFKIGAYLLHYLALLILAVGLIINKSSIATVGFLGVMHPIANALDEIGGFFPLLHFIFFVFLLLCCINHKNAIVWGGVAAFSELVVIVLSIGEGYYKNYKFEEALLMVGVLLLGIAFQTKKAPAKATATVTGAGATVALGTETTIEKLTKLKQLLDDGIITQEEFDTKKKQLIGL